MSLANYSPEDVVILLSGVYTVDGLAEGSFVTISKDSPNYKTTSTSDGRVSRSKVENNTHLVTVTLASYSDSNLIFTAWAAADRFLNSAMMPIFIKDGMGSTMFYAPMAWIETMPSVDMDMEYTERVWEIRTAGGEWTIGGNQSGSPIDTNLASIGALAADFGGLF